MLTLSLKRWAVQYSKLSLAAVVSTSHRVFHCRSHNPSNLFVRYTTIRSRSNNYSTIIQDATQMSSTTKRKLIKKSKKKVEGTKDHWSIIAYAAAEEFNLEDLAGGLDKQGLYQSAVLPEDADDVMHVLAKYQVGVEPREVYIFREGGVVFWNVQDLERISVLKFLKTYAFNAYDNKLVEEESEMMEYSYSSTCPQLKRGKILINRESQMDLQKYAFSNALALSVKLGIWENTMDQFVENLEDIIEDLKSGRQIKLTRDQVLKKMGELFALRHFINLGSDLLDTPDFYWEREALEPLYHQTCHYLNIAKRTKVMNEKMNYCTELMQLLKDHLNDQHHVRLELMIIALIMIEVIFECIHWIV